MMKQHDIFISYRRQDAEAHACMLFRDLTSMGYSVFYDHDTLGAGDFISNILKAIDSCKDFILILSKSALNEKIHDPNDIMRQEISHALQSKKRIIGIMLNGFDSFPDDLPSDLTELPRVNCLFAKMEYYDAMLERLTSGKFLVSIPVAKESYAPSLSAKSNELRFQKVISLPLQDRYQKMKLMLDIAHEFNNSAECMRLYHFLDRYDRTMGLQEIEDYQGRVPLDYATYLSFFETIYLIIATDTVELDLIDEAYRFRFFAACNSPVIQNSELLPLGYQYPNIMALYEIWSEYIRNKYISEKKCTGYYQEITLYQNDLLRRYSAFQLISQLGQKRDVRLVNNAGKRVDLLLRKLTLDDLLQCKMLQQEVLTNILDNKERNIFEALEDEEWRHSLEYDFCVGVFSQDKLVGILSLIHNPTQQQNLLLDLDEYSSVPPEKTIVIDCVLVKSELRGYGLQRMMLEIALFYAKKVMAQIICAVISPYNYYSARNIMKAGYRMVATKPKYHSLRDYYVLEISEDTLYVLD